MIPLRKRDLLVSKAPRRTLVPTQSPNQRVMGDSSGDKTEQDVTGRAADQSPHLVLRLRTNKAVPPFSLTPSWRTQG